MRASLERFVSLTRLPVLATAKERAQSLADALCDDASLTRATVLLFGDEGIVEASAPPEGLGFALRDRTPEIARLLLPSFGRFAVPGGFLVPHERASALAGVCSQVGSCDLLAVPLLARERSLGMFVLELLARPGAEQIRYLRAFADIAAWMLHQEHAVSAVQREARHSTLLALINERTRKSLDRDEILRAVVADLREAFGALRGVIYDRESEDPAYARVVALSESPQARVRLAERVALRGTWLERVFAGSTVQRDAVGKHPNDALLRRYEAGSAMVVPFIADGRVESALALHFAQPRAFDDVDLVMLRSIAFHVGLALANVRLYERERRRRARAESLERIARILRDAQTLEETVLVFAITASHELGIACAVYAIEDDRIVRRAMRAPDPKEYSPAQSLEHAGLMTELAGEEPVPADGLDERLRAALFGAYGGMLIPVRSEGTLWGCVVFAAPAGTLDPRDSQERSVYRTLGAHFELALASALSFERVAELARALGESNEFKDDLLAMLAHDFKGPLTVILGYCDLLLETIPADGREELETIASQTKRLVRLSEDALALAQTQSAGFSLDRAVVDLREAVRESVDAHDLGRGRIQLGLPAHAVWVSLDRARFAHVLDNLILNALKYSQSEVRVWVRPGGKRVQILVADRGIGIPAAELGALFTRFGRASNARRKGIAGSGVGLYVARKIVEVHGGTIAVNSTEDRGSTFIVDLPLAT